MMADEGDASTAQGMPSIARKPPEAGEWDTDSPSQSSEGANPVIP